MIARSVPVPLRRRLLAVAVAACAAVSLGAPAAAADAPLVHHAVQALAWFGGTAYAGTDAGLFRLQAGTWTVVSQIPPNRRVNALAVVGSTLVAATDTGVIRSSDG